MSTEPGVAEVAVAVAHEDHLRGVATSLLRRLGEIARNNGIHSLTADVLAENVAMLRVLSDAGWRHTTHLDGSVLSIKLDLTDPTDPYARGSVNVE
jgi:L-amino acid N-acyltransferase YncA